MGCVSADIKPLPTPEHATTRFAVGAGLTPTGPSRTFFNERAKLGFGFILS
jgi:hypothetical protein